MAVIPGRTAEDGLLVVSPRLRPDPVADILAAAATAIAVAAVSGGVLVLARRLGGGFATAPPPAVGWAVASAGILLVAAVDAARGLGARAWSGTLARVGLMAAAVAVTPAPGAEGWAERVAGLAALLVTSLAVLLPRPTAGGLPRRTEGHPTLGRPRRRVVEPAPRRSPGLPATALETQAEAAVSAGFRQRLERFETSAGEDCVRGRVILSVGTGSRSGQAHVGFCPSFASSPSIELTTEYDGVEAELVVAEVLPWGARLECRLAEPAEEPLEIPVDYLALLAP